MYNKKRIGVRDDTKQNTTPERRYGISPSRHHEEEESG